jgi:N-acetylglucosaminyldiphosphoundecaprenol N-acetyl-beta-D-mannosaminyltransferase
MSYSPSEHSTSHVDAIPKGNSRTPGSGHEVVDVLGVPVALIELNDIIHFVHNSIENNRKGWITGVNGNALNLAYDSVWLKEFYSRAILNCAEGFGVDVAAFLSRVKIPRRKVWVEWAYDLLQMLETNDHSLFLFGSTQEIGEKAIEQLHRRYPRLRIVGQKNGFSDLDQQHSVIESINRAKPDVVFVALGMPKQEEWIYRNYDALDAKILFPVGALIDYISEMKKRCPSWMSTLGLGWVFRLLTEPQKVWRRYLFGNPLLMGRALLYGMQRVHSKENK